MIQYKNGRFHLGPVSLAIPEGALIDTAPELLSGGLTLSNADRTAMLDIFFDYTAEDAFHSLSKVLALVEEEPLRLKGLEAIEWNGLSGYSMNYYLGKETCVEFFFDLEVDGEPQVLIVELGIRYRIDFQPVLQHPDFLHILHSLRLEQ